MQQLLILLIGLGLFWTPTVYAEDISGVYQYEDEEGDVLTVVLDHDEEEGKLRLVIHDDIRKVYFDGQGSEIANGFTPFKDAAGSILEIKRDRDKFDINSIPEELIGSSISFYMDKTFSKSRDLTIELTPNRDKVRVYCGEDLKEGTACFKDTTGQPQHYVINPNTGGDLDDSFIGKPMVIDFERRDAYDFASHQFVIKEYVSIQGLLAEGR